MIAKEELRKLIPGINSLAIDALANEAMILDLDANTEILRQGQYVKVIPLVKTGLIKVFTRFEDKELLLYYIKPGESCIMSFTAGLQNNPSQVFAKTEEDTTAILLPAQHVAQWVKQFPDINLLFFNQFNARYSELIDTINHIIFNKMDVRIYEFLKERAHLTQNPLKISHRQIATELGTAREVVSRLIKKLEKEGKILQSDNSIKILEW